VTGAAPALGSATGRIDASGRVQGTVLWSQQYDDAWEASPATGTLTHRETEICRLAADGLASRAIADRLFLSVRTVNNHLQNAYSKLGVASRGELVDALSR